MTTETPDAGTLRFRASVAAGLASGVLTDKPQDSPTGRITASDVTAIAAARLTGSNGT